MQCPVSRPAFQLFSLWIIFRTFWWNWWTGREIDKHNQSEHSWKVFFLSQIFLSLKCRIKHLHTAVIFWRVRKSPGLTNNHINNFCMLRSQSHTPQWNRGYLPWSKISDEHKEVYRITQPLEKSMQFEYDQGKLWQSYLVIACKILCYNFLSCLMDQPSWDGNWSWWFCW